MGIAFEVKLKFFFLVSKVLFFRLKKPYSKKMTFKYNHSITFEVLVTRFPGESRIYNESSYEVTNFLGSRKSGYPRRILSQGPQKYLIWRALQQYLTLKGS